MAFRCDGDRIGELGVGDIANEVLEYAFAFFETVGHLLKNGRYVGGVIAQTFYVGAQIMCWTFIIQYAGNELGISKADAQGYNLIAMIVFVSSRFICTFLLKFFSPGGLLGTLAIAGGALVCGAIFIEGMPGLYCLMGVSAFLVEKDTRSQRAAAPA